MSFVPNIEYDKTAFGEMGVAQSRAFIQASASYNLIPANFREFTSASGTTGCENKMFKVTTGTSVGGYGAIQSFRALNYKPGEGGLARFTAVFPSNVANSWQGVGLINLSDELSFGYDGTSFGIWHRYGGYAEVRTITLTAGSSGSTNLTLTLNSVAYTIPLTSGTTQHNAYEIEQWLNNDSNQTIWRADQIDATIVISAQSDGAKAGTYSYSHASSTGTIAQNVAGVTKTSDHIAQADWNINTMASLDPTAGNVYQIKYQYLGFGDINFYVEDKDSGEFTIVHRIKYANSNTTPSLTNPSMRIGMYCVSLGSTTDLSVYSASMAAFVQGYEEKTRNPRAQRNTQTLNTSSFLNIITIRNRRTYNGYINQVEIEPLGITISNEGSKNAIIEVRTNPTEGTNTNYQLAGSNLVADYNVVNNSISSGRLIQAFNVAAGQTLFIDVSALNVRMPPSLKLAISGKLTGGASSSVSATISWYEDL